MTPKKWMDYEGSELFLLDRRGAYFYRTREMALDADGAPNAYHPADQGLDDAANAGYPGNWTDMLVADPESPSEPYIQKTGPTAGFFVSMTALANTGLPSTDPRRYVDASAIPYIVFPASFYSMRGTGRLGSLGIARIRSSGLQAAFIVADIGPSHAPLGEVSLRLAERLGGTSPNPRNGAGMPEGPYEYIVFPRVIAVPPWPPSEEALDNLAVQELGLSGGWPPGL